LNKEAEARVAAMFVTGSSLKFAVCKSSMENEWFCTASQPSSQGMFDEYKGVV
jgi:hypothetical protein